jgi:predicted Zn-dependent protease
MKSAKTASPGLKARIARGASALALGAFLLADFSAGYRAYAQESAPAGAMPIIRDAETEELLREYTRPILKAAGLQNQKIEVVIINDKQFNAFVADGRRIFVNLGALTDSKTPNQIIGVLAHETGHIAGGHLARRREQIANMQTMAILAMLAGAGAMVAGARGNNNIGEAAPGILMAPQSMIQRTLLSYVRTQEESADRAGVKFLEATQQSPRGMLETFDRFARDTMFISNQVDPYLQSHPMPRERILNLENLAKQSPYYNKKDPPELQLRHDMMRAKLFAFTDSLGTTLRRYPTSDMSLPARYARAIATYRYGDLRSALAQIDVLISEQPNNPYLYELRGQALLEAGKARDAIGPLRHAVQLSKGAALIRVLLGQALVQTNDKSLTEEAINELRAAIAKEPTAALGYRELAIAYARKGDQPNADLSSAQEAFNNGDIRTARQLALRAQKAFPAGSPGWIKSDDIVNYKPPKL